LSFRGTGHVCSFSPVLSAETRRPKIDELVKSGQIIFTVIPAEAGIQPFRAVLDPGVRRGDDMKDFLRVHQDSQG
jgi:hypothetical protein